MRRTLQKREHRLPIYQELMSLVDAGMNHSEASRQMGVGLRTVQRWLACGVFPERKHRVFPSIVDAYGPHLEKRYGEGCRKIIAALARTQRTRLRRSASTVRSWLRQRFGSPKKALISPLVKRSIPIRHQRIAWLMLKANPTEEPLPEGALRASPEIAALAHTLQEVCSRSSANGMLQRGQVGSKLRNAPRMHPSLATSGGIRMQSPPHCSCPGATGWWKGRSIDSKLIKRQMYGRASFDLLRLRVLHSA